MNCCPHCKGKTGYETRSYASGTVPYQQVWEPEYDHNGSQTNLLCNAQMYDYLNYKTNKYARCLDCGRKIKVDEIEKKENKQ